MELRVRSGDTLWRYSQLFHIPFLLLLDSNRGADLGNLQVGQQIRIPAFLTEAYIIRAGDSLWKIAKQKGVETEALLLVNPGIDPDNLRIGQQIDIPRRVTAPVVNGRRPYDYAALRQDLDRLTGLYPFITRRKIGCSVMGKAIDEIQIGRGSKRVHMNASFHANEWITTPILMQTLNEYLRALSDNRSIRQRRVLTYYNDTCLSLVPMVNPDGVDLVLHGAPAQEPYRSNVLSINGGGTDFSGWKANIRGVDLNDQYPALWEKEAGRKVKVPAPRDFPGYAPLSEPEAAVLADLVCREDFQRVLAYHTQGEVFYWGFGGNEPPEAGRIAGEFARVSGYQAIRNVDSYAGFKDWFILTRCRPGFTVELGSGANPLPLAQFNEIYEENLGIFLAALYSN